MTTHTQGPWVAAPVSPESFVIHPEHHTVWVVAKTFTQEDARLIAAAPDLLMALKEAASEMSYRAATRHSDALKRVKAAITKATGETK